MASPDENLAIISAPDFIPGRQAALERSPPLSSPATDAPLGTATRTNVTADGSTVEVDAKEPAVRVLSDAYCSGWTATVDGAPANVLPASHAFRAVAVPRGRHPGVWSHSPRGQGAAFSVTGPGIVLCVLPWRRRLRRPPRGSRITSSHNPPNMTN